MRRTSWPHLLGLVLVVSCWTTPPPVRGAEILIETTDEGDEPRPSSFFLPLFFQTETSDLGLGLSYNKCLFASTGNIFLAGYGTLNSSYGVLFNFAQFQLLNSRWFLNALGAVTWNTDQRFYGDLATPTGEIEGGTNDSDPEDYFRGEGSNSLVGLILSYTLPIGHGREQIVHRYQTESGLLVANPSGGNPWNPMRSGRTFLRLTPFYQLRTLGVTEDNIEQFPPILGISVGNTAKHRTNGIRLELEYDNRDYSLSPARGSLQRLELDRDFGWFDSSGSWTSTQGEYRKYLSLGSTKRLRQNVFALRAWTAYSKSMERVQFPEATVVVRSPPSNMGATLGGHDRLRGYPRGRFSDRAAVYYSGEWRLIPTWDPVGKTKIAQSMNWRWWQLVLIGEVGRVAPSWNLSLLHEDMKWSAGVGARLMLGARVFRFSLIGSDEAIQFWFVVGQSF